MFTDINAPGYYDDQNIDELIHSIHKAGLYNLSEYLKLLYCQVKELESEVEEARTEQWESSYNDGYSDGSEEARQDNSKVENFASWYLREFEPENKKKIKFKTIGETTFVIMTESDYDDLKSEFHKQCD